jgi:DNA-binding response OmpR family regulator
MPPKVLIAEDDRDLATVVALSVRTLWPDSPVTIAGDGTEALRRFEVEEPDLVLLDVVMPGPDGFEVCRRIRAVSRVPILMLTAHAATVDEVRALELGADDYLAKPFDHLKLLARLRALVRRATGSPAAPGCERAPDFACRDLTLDFSSWEVRVGGEVVELTATEYQLLEALVRHAGRVMPHRMLLDRVWGTAHAHDTHSLKEYVSRLRRKIGDDADHPRYIQTQWGVGYRFVTPR